MVFLTNGTWRCFPRSTFSFAINKCCLFLKKNDYQSRIYPFFKHCRSRSSGLCRSHHPRIHNHFHAVPQSIKIPVSREGGGGGGAGGLRGNFGTDVQVSILKPTQSYTWPFEKKIFIYLISQKNDLLIYFL